MQDNYASEQDSLRTGFYLNSFADINRVDLEIALNFWVNEITKQFNVLAKTKFYDNIEEMRNDFEQQKINFIVASPLPIINHFNSNHLAEGYKIVWDGSAEDSLLIITLKKSKLNHFSELKNKHLSILSNDPIPQIYLDILALENFGKKARGIFKKISTASKSNQLILQLFFNKTDVIVVYKKFYSLAIELNPQIKKNTQIISTLPGVTRVLGYFHKKVDPIFRNSVLTEIYNLQNHTKGQQLLALFHAEKTTPSSIHDLLSTQQLKRRYQQLINQYREHK